MLAEDSPNNQESSRRWVWSDCKLVLRRTNADNPAEESYQNLQAEVELESQDIQEPFMPEIIFQKHMQFNENKGFYCKKGLSLPSLRVKLQKNYLDLLHEDEEIIMIYCDLTIAYPRRKDTHFYLQQICTSGEKRKIFSQQGEVLFDNIKLKQSSIKKFNSKFSFVVSICASSIDENRIILKTLISTAFYCQPRKIIRRNRLVRQISTMKLLSPVKFLKPISCLQVTTLKQHSVEQIVQVIKEMNKNSHRLSKLHPFYLIYHMINMIEVYFHSEQIEDLNQMFERLYPFIENQNTMKEEKSTLSKYELKKTKRIRKLNKNINGIKKHQQQQNLQIQLHNHCAPRSHLILITFHQSILQCIVNEIQRQKALNKQSLFEQEIQKQVIKLTKMFQKWRIFQFKVDLLRKNSIEGFWKDIQKDYVFETYKKHYQMLQEKLTKKANHFIETQKLTDDIS